MPSQSLPAAILGGTDGLIKKFWPIDLVNEKPCFFKMSLISAAVSGMVKPSFYDNDKRKKSKKGDKKHPTGTICGA
jgi:hypothetical protein